VDESRGQRLAEFFRRLAAADPVDSVEAALDLIAKTLNEVEDDLTSIPYDPDAWDTDVRMYPPCEDAARSITGHPAVRRYRNKRHNTFVRANGAFEIQRLDGVVQVSRPGRDGPGVWEIR
jgi:hypothetical protein